MLVHCFVCETNGRSEQKKSDPLPLPQIDGDDILSPQNLRTSILTAFRCLQRFLSQVVQTAVWTTPIECVPASFFKPYGGTCFVVRTFPGRVFSAGIAHLSFQNQFSKALVGNRIIMGTKSCDAGCVNWNCSRARCRHRLAD